MESVSAGVVWQRYRGSCTLQNGTYSTLRSSDLSLSAFVVPKIAPCPKEVISEDHFQGSGTTPPLFSRS